MILHASVLMNREWEGFDRDFQFIQQFLWIVIEDEVWRNLAMADFLHDVRDGITNSSGIREHTDWATFVIGDSELV